MTQRVYLHVGPMKTGSTFLQECLRGRREELAERGVLLPVSTGREHQRAVIDLLSRQSERRSTVSAAGTWQRAVDEIRDWSGDVAVISGETLSAARPDAIARAVASLQPAQVHVVATMRSLAALIPSFWQSNLRNRKGVTWADFSASVRGDADAPAHYGERFWRVLDVAAILDRWAADLPPEQVHVVVMPTSGAPTRALWDRFCAAVGMADPPEPAADLPSNIAVGTEQAEALRRLNVGLAGQYPDHLYARFVKQIATPIAVRAATDSRRMTLPPEDFDWVRDRSQRIVDQVVARGYDVVGPIEDAVPAQPSVLTPAGPFRPDDYRADKVADAATNMALALLAYLRSDPVRGAPEADDELVASKVAAVTGEPASPGAAPDADALAAAPGTVDDLMAQKQARRKARRRARRTAL